jgi:hypothetical protein
LHPILGGFAPALEAALWQSPPACAVNIIDEVQHMIRKTLLTFVVAATVLGSGLLPSQAEANIGNPDTTTVCMPFSPGWMLCTEYDGLEVIRQYMIRDDSDVGYIF